MQACGEAFLTVLDGLCEGVVVSTARLNEAILSRLMA